MSVLDIVLIIPLLYGLIKGLIKGFVSQLTAIIGLIVGIYVAKLYAEDMSLLLHEWLDIPLQIGKPLAFFIAFLAIVLLFHLLANLLEKFFKIIVLEWLNKLLGALFGCLKYALIVSVLLNVFHAIDTKLHLVSDTRKDESKLYHPIKAIVPRIMPYIDFEDFRKKEEKIS